MENKILYEYESDLEELIDNALNDLSPEQFKRFLQFLRDIPNDYED